MSLPLQSAFVQTPWFTCLSDAVIDAPCSSTLSFLFHFMVLYMKFQHEHGISLHASTSTYSHDGPSYNIFLSTQALYPVHQLMQYVSLAAPAPERGMFGRGALAVSLAQREHRAAGASRLHLVMRLPRPAWGSLNITGDVRGWSFTDVLSQARPRTRMLVSLVVGSHPSWVKGTGLHLTRLPQTA